MSGAATVPWVVGVAVRRAELPSGCGFSEQALGFFDLELVPGLKAPPLSQRAIATSMPNSLAAIACLVSCCGVSWDLMTHPDLEVHLGWLFHQSAGTPYCCCNLSRWVLKCGHSCQQCLADAYCSLHQWHLKCVMGRPLSSSFLRWQVRVLDWMAPARQTVSAASR